MPENLECLIQLKVHANAHNFIKLQENGFCFAKNIWGVVCGVKVTRKLSLDSCGNKSQSNNSLLLIVPFVLVCLSFNLFQLQDNVCQTRFLRI